MLRLCSELRLPLWLAALTLWSGCDRGPSDAEVMQREIAPHLDELARYDRWARRLSLAGAAFRSEAALEEAAFAPLRGRPRVVAAWLDRVGPDARSLVYPAGTPELPEDGWVTVQTRDLGELRAQHRTWSLGQAPMQTTLIRRSRPAAGGAVLHVTLAFADPVEPD